MSYEIFSKLTKYKIHKEHIKACCQLSLIVIYCDFGFLFNSFIKFRKLNEKEVDDT